MRASRVLVTHGRGLAISDLARRARLALPSTREAVRRLVDAGFLDVIGAGRGSIYVVRPEHPLAAPIAALFEAERAQGDALLESVRTAAADQRPPLVALWLYGSVARREDGPTSDIDLAAVFEDEEAAARRSELDDALVAASPAHARRFSLITLTPTDAARLAYEGTAIWREIERDAVILTGVSPAEVVKRARAGGAQRP